MVSGFDFPLTQSNDRLQLELGAPPNISPMVSCCGGFDSEGYDIRTAAIQRKKTIKGSLQSHHEIPILQFHFYIPFGNLT